VQLPGICGRGIRLISVAQGSAKCLHKKDFGFSRHLTNGVTLRRDNTHATLIHGKIPCKLIVMYFKSCLFFDITVSALFSN